MTSSRRLGPLVAAGILAAQSGFALTVAEPITSLSAECRLFASGNINVDTQVFTGARTVDCNERAVFTNAEMQVTGKAETGLGRSPKAIAQAEYTSNDGSDAAV